MAIVMEANYSKKLGLPGYSSHQYAVTLRTELSDLTQVDAESARLHTLLQTSVDREIQKVGFLPEKGNGNTSSNGNGNGRNGPVNGNGHANGAQSSNENREVWNCSPKQKQYIIDLVGRHRLDKNAVEHLAQDRFSKSVRALNKLEASGLIEELKEQVAGNGQLPHPPNGRANQPAGMR
jgi:hypothetical protein